jgi:hypothetical protein
MGAKGGFEIPHTLVGYRCKRDNTFIFARSNNILIEQLMQQINQYYFY